jgi:Rrf2 family protein
MISISRKTDYALIALSCLVGHEHRTMSAREIARMHDLPLPLVMNILKTLQHSGILCSTRGPKGGYRVVTDLETLSLLELIRVLDDNGGRDAPDADRPRTRLLAPPLQALYHRMMGFLKQVKVLDLIAAGRRIDVPVEMVRIAQRQVTEDGASHRCAHALVLS